MAATNKERGYREIRDVVQLRLYHHHKYQRATKHLRDLYEAHKDGLLERAKHAISEIEVINSRIRILNEENSLPTDLGTIDYGTFLYAWDEERGRYYTKVVLEEFCQRKRYVKGWSTLPPRDDFRFFEEPISSPGEGRPPIWDILSSWLMLFWNLCKHNQEQFLASDCQMQLLNYVKNGGFSLHCNGIRYRHHALCTVVVCLREMSEYLNNWKMKQQSTFSAFEYGIRREDIRRICEFEGLPIGWIPNNIDVEGQGQTKVRIKG
ncbi:hypothetical protein AAWM_03316 [Aspergillus awamori]|uniref:Uncharacterized protein n=1 Tax=Aspergillus awamori TaxID=105351 RepID=A0A401KME1_ASPAW|nr:hypothetical protein AAWM_03316 [Aspergillus awamori]